MSVGLNSARAAFLHYFQAAATHAARAPGRVNIIGEHTDYNGGFVLPMAIERDTLILARPRDDGWLRVYAANLDADAEVSLDGITRQPKAPWLDYVLGVALELQKLGHPPTGADMLIKGDVPIGAGLSSSASLEMAALALFEQMGGFTLGGPEGARLGRRVENEFLGLNSGVMDQFIARMGKAGHALFLDCHSGEFEHVPVAFDEALFAITNTGVSRGLSASKYNERVQECADAVSRMAQATGRITASLRDFTGDDLEACAPSLPEHIYRRARHVITENARTLAARDALRAGDAARLGELMNASDLSLRHDYEVTCPELDIMTSIARGLDGCYGARMTGAGFGGCVISLVDKKSLYKFGPALLETYRAQTGISGTLITSSPAAGASAMTL